MSSDIEIAEEQLTLQTTTVSEKKRLQNLQEEFAKNKIRVQVKPCIYLYMSKEEFNEYEAKQKS